MDLLTLSLRKQFNAHVARLNAVNHTLNHKIVTPEERPALLAEKEYLEDTINHFWCF